MIEAITDLGTAELELLAAAIRAGRIDSVYSTLAIQRVIGAERAPSVAVALKSLGDGGVAPHVIASMIALLARDRRKNLDVENAVDLVITGPEARGISNRDTSVVVRELFANARTSVLLAGFAIYQGQRLFAALAEQMSRIPALQVRMFLDIKRPHGDSTTAAELVRRFAHRFLSTQWPVGAPHPQVYYYPLSVSQEPERRASLHAKCVIVDTMTTFVSSANFTAAAQERNIEVGVLIRSSTLSAQLSRYFDALVEDGIVAELDLRGR